MVGFKLSYGHYLDRELHLTDSKTNKTEVVYDDGSFMLDGDKVVARRHELAQNFVI